MRTCCVNLVVAFIFLFLGEVRSKDDFLFHLYSLTCRVNFVATFIFLFLGEVHSKDDFDNRH
jgi:hypothetical protein